MHLVNKRSILNYLPIFIFVLIVVHHFYWVDQAHLSPWLGGGYGMFSTTDYGPTRYVKAYGLRDNIIQEEIEVPQQFAMQARATRGLPSDNNILKLALSIENYLDSNQHNFPVIRVEIWTSQYDKDTLHPTYLKLKALDYKTSLVIKPE